MNERSIGRVCGFLSILVHSIGYLERYKCSAYLIAIAVVGAEIQLVKEESSCEQ